MQVSIGECLWTFVFLSKLCHGALLGCVREFIHIMNVCQRSFDIGLYDLCQDVLSFLVRFICSIGESVIVFLDVV
jgi:hypothetical protein